VIAFPIHLTACGLSTSSFSFPKQTLITSQHLQTSTNLNFNDPRVRSKVLYLVSSIADSMMAVLSNSSLGQQGCFYLASLDSSPVRPSICLRSHLCGQSNSYTLACKMDIQLVLGPSAATQSIHPSLSSEAGVLTLVYVIIYRSRANCIADATMSISLRSAATFTLFPKLPTEIRLQIWKTICYTQRNVDITTGH
jgi:hypothetical protein